jgi:archaellum component FlaC
MTVREHDNLRIPNRTSIDDDLELMSLRRLSDSLEATRAMLQSAQKIARDTQSALMGLANEFCGAEMQKQQAQSSDLIQFAPDELAAMLRSRFKTLKLLSGNGTTSRLSEANQTIIDLRAELETQRNQANYARQQVKRLENQVRSLERTLEKERRSKMEVQDATN